MLCYIQSTDPADKDAWKDKGTGQLSIKCKEGISKGTKESKPTIVIRNDVWVLFDSSFCLSQPSLSLKSLLTTVGVSGFSFPLFIFYFFLFYLKVLNVQLIGGETAS